MTSRGGPRVPDGVPRPSNLPFARGPNRSDLAELPGTPGTELPASPTDPQVSHGQAGQLRERLGNIPIDQVLPGQLTDSSMNSDEPVTSGINAGAGPGVYSS